MLLAPEDIVGPTGHPGRPCPADRAPDKPVDRWMPLLGDAGEGLSVAPLGEPAQQLRVELSSSAGAVMGDVDIPVSAAQWKAARRFNA